MSGAIVAGGLSFRAGVALGAHGARRFGSMKRARHPRRADVWRTTSTGRVRLGACADATATEAKKADSRKQEPKTKADTEKQEPKKADAAKEAKKKDTSSSAEKASAIEPPAPPAAPAGYDKEIKRLQKAGVEVHDFGTAYLDDGKNNEHVKELQRFLKGTGHYNYKDGPTGYFGPLTAEAVRKWQRKYGLPESGGWGAQSRATYLQVKHAELRAMRDPEAAASWTKSAVANGLVNKATGLPVPPSIGDGRSGEARPSWVASAGPSFGVGIGTHAGASGGKLAERLPGVEGPGPYVAAAIFAVGAILLRFVATRGGAGEETKEPRRPPGARATLPGFGGPAADASEGTIEDERVWREDGDDASK